MTTIETPESSAVVEQVKHLYGVASKQYDEWMDHLVNSSILQTVACQCGERRGLLVDATVCASQRNQQLTPRYDICMACAPGESYAARRRNAGLEQHFAPIKQDGRLAQWPSAPSWARSPKVWIAYRLDDAVHWWLMAFADSRYIRLEQFEHSQEHGIDFYKDAVCAARLMINLDGARCEKLAKLIDARSSHPAAKSTWLIGGDKDGIEAAKLIPEEFLRA